MHPGLWTIFSWNVFFCFANTIVEGDDVVVSSVIWYLIIGAVAGWLAGTFVKGHGFGLWADLIVGIVGAFIGGFAFSLLGIRMTGIVGELISSTIGAVVLLLAIRLVSGGRSNVR